MAVAANALTSRTNLKEFLGIASADTSKDTALDNVIDRVTLFLEGETQRKLKARRYGSGADFTGTTHPTTSVADEDFLYFSGSTTDMGGDTVKDPRGYGLYYLPAYPVQANPIPGTSPAVNFTLAPLRSRDESGVTWDTALTENVDYLLNRTTGELRLFGGFTPADRNYRVTMCAGYVTVPADLEGLCLEFCRSVYRNDRTLASESIGTWSRSFATTKSDPYVEGLLARYARIAL